ncbi:type II toxin-antitoxin system PemK/MazF family toxin [Candidatus Woesearchaeota archaeon]|nr:type II toxin-antitoxin system PemK/MazF family toxin [Candidatus Woesearchaeota archaeon]
MKIQRGDIVLVNLDPVVGSEQGKIRPALVIQNNIGNETSPTTIVAPVTSKIFTKEFPTNVEISSKISKLEKNSTILLNQIRTIDKSRIIRKLSNIDSNSMEKVNLAIKVSLGLE